MYLGAGSCCLNDGSCSSSTIISPRSVKGRKRALLAPSTIFTSPVLILFQSSTLSLLLTKSSDDNKNEVFTLVHDQSNNSNVAQDQSNNNVAKVKRNNDVNDVATAPMKKKREVKQSMYIDATETEYNENVPLDTIQQNIAFCCYNCKCSKTLIYMIYITV